MSLQQTRRQFLKTAIASAGAVAASRIFHAPAILSAPAPNSKLGVAVIGCGGKGSSTHVPFCAREERLVALVDADEKKLGSLLHPPKKSKTPLNLTGVKTFTDYRRMFDAMGKDVDAVFIATPNHHHALPALIAMQLGKHAYVEKPMAYDIWEARTMAEFSRQYKVASQMGNQGHSGEGYRRLCEYIWAGAIGPVTEVHCWSNRANGGIGPRPPALPVPAGMNWDSWIGPAPFREYHKDLHPHEWHGWHDFGNGSLGNMGCHVMDGAHWALKLDQPTSIEVEQMVGGTKERYPIGTRIRWDFPARGDMPPVKVYWWDGKRSDAKNAGRDADDTIDSVSKLARNRPPLVDKLEKEYKRDFGGNGTFYIGDKGIMYTGTYGEGTRIIPEEKHKATPVPAISIPRVKGGHQGDFTRACRGGEPACSNFEVAARLTELILLGDLAIKAGLNKTVEWDGVNAKCTNLPELNRFIHREARQGWTV